MRLHVFVYVCVRVVCVTVWCVCVCSKFSLYPTMCVGGVWTYTQAVNYTYLETWWFHVEWTNLDTCLTSQIIVSRRDRRLSVLIFIFSPFRSEIHLTNTSLVWVALNSSVYPWTLLTALEIEFDSFPVHLLVSSFKRSFVHSFVHLLVCSSLCSFVVTWIGGLLDYLTSSVSL